MHQHPKLNASPKVQVLKDDFLKSKPYFINSDTPDGQMSLVNSMNTLPITGLRNLGPESARMLADAGLYNADDLRELGPVVCFLAVRQAGHRPSLNLLWAIDGAIDDMAWNELPEARKASLMTELRELTK